MPLGAVGVAIALWLLVVLVSGLAGSLAKRLPGEHKQFYTVLAAQSTSSSLSLLLAYTLQPSDPSRLLGLVPAAEKVPEAVLVSITVSALFLAVLVTVLPQALGEAGHPARQPKLEQRAWEIVLTGMLIAPLGEELFYRGLLEGILLHWEQDLAIAIQALLFAITHYSQPGYRQKILATSYALLGGIVAGYYRAITGSLAPALASHTAFNAAPVILVLLARRGGGYCLYSTPDCSLKAC